MRTRLPPSTLPLPVLLLALLALPAGADEGMWPVNLFPSERVAEKYGFRPSQEWLDRVRLSSARLARGCSGSFVSPQGLVMTNHHCARECVEELSTARRNYVALGFTARTQAAELRCPVAEVNQLVAIRDVTAEVRQATQGLEGERFKEAQRTVFARLESACATSPRVRCDVVTLYGGGRYDLYQYKRFQDVRLVFAPEEDIAFFGGDPDNFEFPRYAFDVAFLRVYEDGKPARMEQSFPVSPKGAQEGQLVFTSGHPGSTSRLATVAELVYQRDFALPERLMWLAELRGVLDEYQRRGPEQARTATGLRFGVDNTYKAMRGRREALVDRDFWALLVERERSFREKALAQPQTRQEVQGTWEAIARAMDALRPMRQELRILEQSAGAGSQLFALARTLVRAVEEQQKPEGERLEEYTGSRRPQLEQELLSTAPLYPQLEATLLTFWLRQAQERLGPDHPAVKEMLGRQSPTQVAHRLVRGTRLADPAVRRRLYQGGPKAVEASKDPLLVFVRRMDGAARAVRRRYENEVESVVERNHERLARARFEVYGTRIYPDATFTLRLSYGQVKGYDEDGRQVPPFTFIRGLYERATGQEPFELPASWERARARLQLDTPMNFVSDNDIIGGNSGSPVINQDAQVVGLIFDGNRYSLGGEYGFDERRNRAVSVHGQTLGEALEKVYGTERLLEELGLQRR